MNKHYAKDGSRLRSRIGWIYERKNAFSFALTQIVALFVGLVS